MRRAAVGLIVSCVVSAVALIGCKKKDETPNPQYGQPQPQPQPAYTQPTATTPPPTTPTPTTGTGQPTASGGFPCQSDATCITHKCNLTAGKCAWPCQTNDDCMAGNQCMAGLGTCAPAGIPGATP